MYRERSLRQLAHQLGFSYDPGDAYGLAGQLADFRLFSTGRKRQISHLLRRQDGLMDFDINLFDYQYTPYGASKDKAVHQTVFFLQSARLGLPGLRLEPETLLHKMGELFGMQDIDFVRFPKFSGQYRLTGDDEEYIRHHFTDEVLNYFTLRKGWTVEGLGFYLLVYKKGLLLPPGQIESLYRRGTEIYGLLTDEEAQRAIFGHP